MPQKLFRLLAALPLSLLVPGIALAEQQGTAPPPAPAGPTTEQQIDFAADGLNYDDGGDVITALGHVDMTSESNRVRADRIVWNRKSGEVRADGNVIVTSPSGDTLYSESMVLTDALRDGAMSNLLLILSDGGRLAARHGVRNGDIVTLDQAAYSPCPVIDSNGCPRRPSWQISAVKIIHDAKRERLKFKDASISIFGIRTPTIPEIVQPLGDDGTSGLLMFGAQYTRTNGVEVTVPYYYKIAPNRDLTVTGHIYSATLPLVEAEYRALASHGAYRVAGYLTDGSVIPVTGATAGSKRFRGYLDASGKFQLDPLWSISFSLRRATDRTFLRRYDLPYDDRLRSMVDVERIDAKSYLSIGAWATQTLRSGEDQGQVPLAAPVIDYRRRIANNWWGGHADVTFNALALSRAAGQDTQRAFAAFEWNRRSLTNLGQEVLLTAYARGDVYNSSRNLLTATTIYRGLAGFQTRAIGALAAEIRWPFIGTLGNGIQRLTPRIQIVASPTTTNLAVPNEDARSVELEDSNLFALNRFPGYDRWEDGPRLTWGLDWAFDAPRLSVTANIGQSYRLSSHPTILPPGTGLSDRTSDIVGRTTVKYSNFLRLTHRYRLDKDKFAVRRNELDLNIGSDDTYATIGYLKLNRHIPTTIEDLRDREEVRLGGRVKIGKFVSVFGTATVDLTTRAQDPLSLSDGYQPIRHQFGIAYTDDCLDIGFTWRRDYDNSGDARRGDSFVLRLAFRGLGR